MFSEWKYPRVSGKLASLRSRIRGGQDICVVEMFPAAQFLTLRLCPSVSTERGCVDLDGPGHAPPYLDVRPNTVKLRTHLIYLAVITVVCYVAIANIVKLNGINSGKSMYVANFNDLQSQLSKAVKDAVDENVNKTDYGAVMNEILASGKIKLTHNDTAVSSIQFSNLKQSDGITSPYVTMIFKTPMAYYDRHMDGVSFVYREGIQVGYVSKSVKDDKVNE